MAIDDGLLAAIISIGLKFDAVSRQDAIAWADQEIEHRTEVPAWLIDLSMSNSVDLPDKDKVELLSRVGNDADKGRIWIGICVTVHERQVELGRAMGRRGGGR